MPAELFERSFAHKFLSVCTKRTNWRRSVLGDGGTFRALLRQDVPLAANALEACGARDPARDRPGRVRALYVRGRHAHAAVYRYTSTPTRMRTPPFPQYYAISAAHRVMLCDVLKHALSELCVRAPCANLKKTLNG
eukprot:2062627-Rhodomonas_salina.1